MTDAANPLFPELEPYAMDWLQVSDVHRIYYEQCGSPDGQPVVVLHGGPGSGCSLAQRRFFDPAHYRIVLFDQRGCNRSMPPGCVEDNTTWHLVEDIERLRTHLGIARWQVFGGSWGSSLALAYACAHPEAVAALILRGIFLCRPAELEWFLHQVRWFFPEPWERMVGLLAPHERHDVASAYHRRIFGGDRPTALEATRAWNAFESAIMTLLPAGASVPTANDDAAIARMRVYLHFLVNNCFLGERPLLDRVDRIRSIPAVIVQGRYDMVCPPLSAYELHQAWPEATLNIIPDAGHTAGEPSIAAALVQATESFKQYR